MNDMFNGASSFNQDITGWNTSKVTRMDYMFKEAVLFDQDIRVWDVSQVYRFTNMFAGDVAFQDTYGIPDTPVAAFFVQFDNAGLYTAVQEHFLNAALAQAKYGKLEKYNTALVTDMCGLFRDRPAFNLDISGWNTANVEQFEDMFNGAEAFNQDIGDWDVSKVKHMDFMFKNAIAFNQNIAGEYSPEVPGTEETEHTYVLQRDDSYGDSGLSYKVTDKGDGTEQDFPGISSPYWSQKTDNVIFKEGHEYDIEYTGDYWVPYETSFSLTDDNGQVIMSATYTDSGNHVAGGIGGKLASHTTYNTTLAIAVERPTVPGYEVSKWNTSNVITINNMFDGAIVFNQNVGLWNVSSVKVMNNMFDGAIAFNNEVRSWTLNDDANVDGGCYTDLFKGATAFHTAFGTNDTTSRAFFTQTNAELKAATLEFNQMELGATGYDAAKEAAAEAKYGFFSNLYTKSDDMSYLFTSDFNRSITTWKNLDQVTTIEGMFENAVAYNKVLPTSMPLLTNMSKLFKGATAYNQPFDLYPLVTDISSAFEGATAFDQDISGWNTHYVTTMSRLFKDTSYNKDIGTGIHNGKWNTSNVTDFKEMLHNNGAFYHDIRDFDVSSTADLTDMLNGATLFKEEYGLPVTVNTPDYRFFTLFTGIMSSAFNTPLQLRMGEYDADVEGTKAIYGDINHWNVDGITSFAFLTYFRSWNHDISEWRMNGKNYCNYMFFYNGTFNQNISTKIVTRPSGRQYIAWDMSDMEEIHFMCYYATNFNNGDTPASELYEVRGGNNPINWDVRNTVYAYYTFRGCTNFNQCVNSDLVTLVANGVTTEYISMDFAQDFYNGFKYYGMYDCPYFNNGDIAKGSSKPMQNKSNTIRGYFGAMGRNMITIQNATLDAAKTQQLALGRTFTGAFNQPWEHNDVTYNFSNGTVVTYNPLTSYRNSYQTQQYFQNQLAFNQPVTNDMLGTDGTKLGRVNYVFRAKMFKNCESFNSDLGDKLFEDLYTLNTYEFHMSYDDAAYSGLEKTFENCKALNKPIPLISNNRLVLSYKTTGGRYYKSLRNMFKNCESLNQDMSAFMQSFANVANQHTT
ncbi:MAG: BspA family leucine-rich repeat surface protein, partial [Gammaproteobacteria bacterium]|nr:BspA family leucine-rich repeat surface protein [Gammaproteobacteria bacterium]